jgi:hypothetical protein
MYKPIFQKKYSYAVACEYTGDIRALMINSQKMKSTAGTDNNGGSIRQTVG